MKKAVVIGGGVAGLSSACYLAKSGYHVTLLEKNDAVGGRARSFSAQGFTFDMGPSWYWMPDVFERFFADFGKQPSDYYQLIQLDPSYRVFFDGDQKVDLPATSKRVAELFEKHEKGSGEKLMQFLKDAKKKYELGMKELVQQPGLSVKEYMRFDLLSNLFQPSAIGALSKHIRKFISDPQLIQVLEFPVLFLGAAPQKMPALYSLMNYADIELGTWYPMGGMFQLISAMQALAESLGVEVRCQEEVVDFTFSGKSAVEVKTVNGVFPSDVIVATADYHHIDQHILPKDKKNYNSKYWNSRVMAPSCLLYYLGINRKISGLLHHNLFFDEDMKRHTDQIYKHPEWPSRPLLYVCCPSKTDPGLAPEGNENLFILIPVAPGLKDNEEVREQYFDIALNRIARRTGVDIRDNIVFKRSYAHNDFVSDYNAFKGNAYGLANTLRQTAMLKPSMKSKKVNNLYYAGQLTVPGPGVPPSIISGKVVTEVVSKEHAPG